MKEIKLVASEFGLEEQKAAQISAQFKPMLDKMVELESEYNEVLKLDIEDTETGTKAKETRLKYVKVRTGTAEIHKAQKAFYLAGGKFVDGWKNAQLFASEGIEKKLMEIEKHAENLETERVEKLHLERVELCKPHVEDESFILPDLGNMSESMWDNYIIGLKTSSDARKEAAKKLELERIEKERIEKLTNERDFLLRSYFAFIPDSHPDFGTLSESEWNDFFIEMQNAKKADDKKQAEIAAENLRLKKEADKKEIEAAELKKKQDAVLAKQKADADTKIKSEKEKSDKLAAELKKKDEEEKAELKRLADVKAKEEKAARGAALAPEKDKITNWIDSFSSVELDTKEFSAEGQAIVYVINQKFESFKNWANEQKNSIK